LSQEGGEQLIDCLNCATGALDRSHWAIRSAKILAVFEDGKPDIGRISLRTGIETRAHLESTHKQALRLEKADQAAVRSRLIPSQLQKPVILSTTTLYRISEPVK
jgi:hypothetical protein